MSSTASSRPRPKPRPRPVPVQSANTTNASVSGSGSTITIPSSEIVINDSDELFLINRGRTRETWGKLDEINKVTTQAASDSDSDGSGLAGTPLKKRLKKETTPQWRKGHENLRFLPAESSDELDSDIEITSITTPAKGKNVLPRKQHQREKSRSITPPPALPATVLANAREIIRRALDMGRAPSPTGFDDFDNSADTITLDPELEQIAKAVNSQAARKQSIPNHSDENAERVVIHVKWQKHPLIPLEREQTWSYRMRVDEPFRELFESVADDAQVLVATLVLTYKNKRIFPSTKPGSLGLWGDVELIGCNQRTYDYLQQQARELRQNQSPGRERLTQGVTDVKGSVINVLSNDENSDNSDIIDETANVDAAEPQSQIPTQESDAESEADAEKFKLVLRSDKVSKDITLIVRPTTKCSAIIKTYIRKAGLADQYPHIFEESVPTEVEVPLAKGRGRGKGGGAGRGRGKGKAQVPSTASSNLPDPRLVVDGDKLDNNTEIGGADLDDGDMVDVAGL